jgi:YHS domain-containing protein
VTRVFLLVILTFLIVRALRIVLRGVVVGLSGPPRPRSPAVKLVRDPVCGTHVTPRNTLSLTSKGTTYYFCSEQCRDKFRTKR